MTDYSLVPANEIWYTTTDGKAIELSATTEEKTVSNTYKDGKGVIVFKEPLTVIKVDYFAAFAAFIILEIFLAAVFL